MSMATGFDRRHPRGVILIRVLAYRVFRLQAGGIRCVDFGRLIITGLMRRKVISIFLNERWLLSCPEALPRRGQRTISRT